ncbi:hypothetical protein BDR05DRAFT_848810, partial [Suillus weaverae]
GETFYDRKSNYSLGCQAVILPHNLLIVDYSLGHPGSVHDPFTFQSTCLYDEHTDLLPDGHWVWADSAYPLEPWCIAPFKRPRNGWLTKDQKTFNYHLSKVCFFIPSRATVRIQAEKDLKFAVQWIKCCIILHNMIICFE